MNKKLFVPILTACLTVLTAAWFWQTQTVRVAPGVTFKTITGESIRLADLRGKPALITFWATDCPGCIEEIPHLIALHSEFAGQGLTVIAAAMHYDPPNHVLEMAKSRQIPYAIALDTDGTLAEHFDNVQLTPTTFLIDRAGNIVMQKVGVFDLADMRQRLTHM